LAAISLVDVVSSKVLVPLGADKDLVFAERSKAAAPAAKGVDIDVPERTAKLPSATGYVERIFPPGAAKEGLNPKSKDGP